jgi:hypothetical protein
VVTSGLHGILIGAAVLALSLSRRPGSSARSCSTTTPRHRAPRTRRPRSRDGGLSKRNGGVGRCAARGCAEKAT